MNKLLKKVFLSTITLLLTITTFASTTFAWLTMNSEAWVEGMDFQATGGEGFLISVDGNNFKSSLSNAEILKAIVQKYYNGYYVFTPTGELVDPVTQIPVDYANLMKNNIRLLPVTSVGTSIQELQNIDGVISEVSEGRFVEFDIYFSYTSGDGSQEIDIYLNGMDTVLNQSGQSIPVPKTSISSKDEMVKLSSKLTSIYRVGVDSAVVEQTPSKIEYEAFDFIHMSPSNAIRLGIINEELSTGTKHQIIELTDKYDLGSYATDSTEVPIYDANRNAMFTYVNGLKNNVLTAIAYSQKPDTITALTALDNGIERNIVKIAQLNEQQKQQCVTFKLWLEGWDADCLEGISKAIQVQLSFAQA